MRCIAGVLLCEERDQADHARLPPVAQQVRYRRPRLLQVSARGRRLALRQHVLRRPGQPALHGAGGDRGRRQLHDPAGRQGAAHQCHPRRRQVHCATRGSAVHGGRGAAQRLGRRGRDQGDAPLQGRRPRARARAAPRCDAVLRCVAAVPRHCRRAPPPRRGLARVRDMRCPSSCSRPAPLLPPLRLSL